MDVRLVNIDDVRPYEANPRINDQAVDAVAASLREFGFRQPIVVDEQNVIIVGHTRWKAAKKLGLAQVPVHVARDLSPERVKAYRIADNQTATLTGRETVMAVADAWDAIVNLQQYVQNTGAPPTIGASTLDSVQLAPALRGLEPAVSTALLELGRRLSSRIPEGAIGSTPQLGNQVHRILQHHYQISHPQNCVLTEARFSGPCASGGTLRSAAYTGANVDLGIWAFALGTGLGSQRRPDVVDLTTREVWEIKPRNEITEGLLELWGEYILPANSTIDNYNSLRSSTADWLDPYRPGNLWKPNSYYLVNDHMVAWIHAEIPGIWYYDIFDLTRVRRTVPGVNPVGMLVFVLALVLLFDPIPGDEAAIPVLAAGVL